ncbi:MAG: hypothetical protein M3536_00215 [Actinomycetota bacterium]|nr:hypothetical protein [Actinomycetota bacterium]
MTRTRAEQDGIGATGGAGGVEVALGVNEGADGALTAYPKHPAADDVYYITGAWAPSCITAKEKRFTDAELAAEYWRKAGEFDACAEGYSTGGDGYNFESEEIESERTTTLYRFHSLPHYDEEPA